MSSLEKEYIVFTCMYNVTVLTKSPNVVIFSLWHIYSSALFKKVIIRQFFKLSFKDFIDLILNACVNDK